MMMNLQSLPLRPQSLSIRSNSMRQQSLSPQNGTSPAPSNFGPIISPTNTLPSIQFGGLDGFFNLFRTYPQIMLNAAKSGNAEKVMSLINGGQAGINDADVYGNTALSFAAGYGHLELAKQLIQTPNVNLNVQNDMLNTPIHLAGLYKQDELVKLLASTPKVDLTLRNVKKLNAHEVVSMMGNEALSAYLADKMGLPEKKKTLFLEIARGFHTLHCANGCTQGSLAAQALLEKLQDLAAKHTEA